MDESGNGNGNSVRKNNFNHHAEGSYVNLERIAELEQVNSELKRTLQDNAQDFKDLLGQLDALRHDVQGKDAQIRDLQSEIRLRPNLAQMNSKQVQIEQLNQQIESQR